MASNNRIEGEWLSSILLPVVVAGGLMLIFVFADGFGCKWTQDLRQKAKQVQIQKEIQGD